MDFAEEYQRFLEYHRKNRSGNEFDRLTKGLGHAETEFLRQIWWPVFHHFDHLYPEYEVRDYRNGNRFIDFAYIEPYFRVAIEIDGFGPHWKDITQWQFAEHNQRQNTLVIDGWYVLRFAYHSIQQEPRICQQTIQQLLGQWQTNNTHLAGLSIKEREVIRFFLRSDRSVKPQDIANLLLVSPKNARLLLHQLTIKRWVVPTSGQVRHTSYSLHPSRAYSRV